MPRSRKSKGRKKQVVLGVAQEAAQLVAGPRQHTYGNPYSNWKRTADIWSVVLGFPVSPRQAALCMIGTKLAREVHRRQRDNLVDIAGYAAVVELIDKGEEAIDKMIGLAIRTYRSKR